MILTGFCDAMLHLHVASAWIPLIFLSPLLHLDGLSLADCIVFIDCFTNTSGTEGVLWDVFCCEYYSCDNTLWIAHNVNVD